MLLPVHPHNEEERLQRLYELDILYTLEEQAYDDLTKIAAQICDVPIALISLIDRECQFLKSHYGLDINEISRQFGFCPHAILDDNLTIVEDATKDERFFDNPLVTGPPHVRFYAGAPLIFEHDLRLGTLCVVDHKPRHLTQEQKNSLEILARQTVSQLELRKTIKKLEKSNDHRLKALNKLKYSEERERSRSDILEKLAKGFPLSEVLESIVHSIEKELPGEPICSILILDDEGKNLLHGAAPNLPCFYNEAINNLAIGPQVGSCGAAAFERKRFIVEDIQQHPNWQAFLPLARQAGLAACWSEPIFGYEGKILGTFAIYYKQPRKPDAKAISIIEYAAHLAGIAIEGKKKEQLLITARDEAEFANQAKSQFLSRMSHELRTPLNAILGFAQLLYLDYSESPEETSEKKNLEQILNSGWYLLDVVNDLLDLAAIEANKMEFHCETVELLNIIEDAINVMQPLAQKKQIKLNHEHNACTGVLTHVDPTRLKQVLLNLISNAIKYNKTEGRVTISCEFTEHDMICVEVTDTGTGIPEERLPELFEPFSRLYLETETVEGQGIGLNIAKQMTEHMGGRIGVTSVLGRGSTFWLELPLDPESVKKSKSNQFQSKDELIEAKPQETTILYIEDTPSHIQLMQSIIKKMPGLNLLTAHTPQLGLELALVHKPNIILLDICLKGISGYEVREQLAANKVTQNIPVVAISANAMPQDIEKGLNAGFKRYLTKPIEIEKLRNTIDELCSANNS